MRVGLLGGSFNPPHEGHRHVAEVARAALDLDRIIWLVSPKNPLKAAADLSLNARMAAVRALANPHDAVSGLEAELGASYTVPTLRWLRRRYRGVRFFWLMGSDNLVGLHRWKRWRDLPKLVEFVVVPRPGSTVSGPLAPGGRLLRRTGRARFLEAKLVSASSTALRSRASKVDSIGGPRRPH
jgi:nicotinate-nucleotide adenylyltransferase